MADAPLLDAERQRLLDERERHVPWHRWGPYLAERQWGTVREDYSANGDAWHYFPHDQARSRAYRWGEDGLLGWSDNHARLCFAVALWNGADPILKERLFGLTGPEGNHGEDVKEYFFFQDGLPSHAYMRGLYKYPQRAFPYDELVQESGRRSRLQPEFELLDTGVFADNRYFDVQVEYAKVDPADTLIRISVTNRGPEPSTLHLLPTLWFRNSWSWGHDEGRPKLALAPDGDNLARADHPGLGTYWFAWQHSPQPLFTENETNAQRLWNTPNQTPYVKDAFHRYVVNGEHAAVNPAQVGTKLALYETLQLAPGATETRTLRLSHQRHHDPLRGADELFARRRAEADAFYAHGLGQAGLSEDERAVQRQAFAGLLWSKQYYHFWVEEWLDGDPGEPTPPPQRQDGRNAEWRHLHTADVLSMPDTWEYPWFAAWDLAFHCVAFALLDPDFAKRQLVLLLREWYTHPNGQLPAYEWAFGDVNPPVHAWAAWHVFNIDRRVNGTADYTFLARVFQKLLLNFTWWVNRKDANGRNIFAGGFLGLDNIGVFDRSASLAAGEQLEQSDGTAWMGMYCLNMLTIALELACVDPAYEDVATKFFEHFLYIAAALNNLGGDGTALWDDSDEFFYDVLHTPSGNQRLKVRSLVGLIPLLAVTVLQPDVEQKLPSFARRMEWFLTHRPELASLVSRWYEPGSGEQRLLALVRGHRMKALLHRMLDPQEFLSDFGIRAVSRYHLAHPYSVEVNGQTYSVQYEPAESTTGLFGGNSNWRGPIWFPINYLLVEALRSFHRYYGDNFLVEAPTGSGQTLTLAQTADLISERLRSIFLRNADGRRPVYGGTEVFQSDPHWRDNLLFFEYFHGDNGAGLGASHQTGWTALVAPLLELAGLARGEGGAEDDSLEQAVLA